MKLNINLELLDSSDTPFVKAGYVARIPANIAKIVSDLVLRAEKFSIIREGTACEESSEEMELYTAALTSICSGIINTLPDEQMAEVALNLDSNGNISLN